MSPTLELGVLTERLTGAETADDELVTLSWSPIVVTIRTRSQRLLNQVMHRYQGYLSARASSLPTPDLVCIVDADLAAGLSDVVEAGPGVESSETGVVASSVSSNSSEPAVVLVPRSGARVLVLASDGAGAAAIAIRQVRAVAAAALLRSGWIPIHASGVVDERGRALVLFGPRSAGKTTMLLSLLMADGWELVANDTIFLRGEDALRARGLPVSIGVRPNTMRMFPALGQAAGRNAVRQADPAGSDLSMGTSQVTRTHLPPDEVAAALGATTARGGDVHALVRLRFDERPRAFSVRELSSKELAASLGEVRLESDPGWTSTWIGLGDGPMVDTAQIACVAAAGGWDMTYGADTSRRALDELRSLL